MTLGGLDMGSNAGLLEAKNNDVARVRSELFVAFTQGMNAAGIRYCILSGSQSYPEAIASDVDFMIEPRDAGRIAPLLLEAARLCGALLVQSIRHETGATYFALAKQTGCGVAYLHPDCTADYRRDGRLWLRAEAMLDRRQRCKTFFVPATADEFQYYLVKKVLKQEITYAQWQHITALYSACGLECGESIREFWTAKTAAKLTAALTRWDQVWIRSHLLELLVELRHSEPVERRTKRLQQCLREWRRVLERVGHPTGLSITVRGGTKRQREALAAALEENLKSAFRHTRLCSEEMQRDILLEPLVVWLAKVRSTLVIRTRKSARGGWFARNEVAFRFSAGNCPDAAINPDTAGSPAWCALPEKQPMQQNLERATRFTLEYLANRLRRRMKMSAAPTTARRLQVSAIRQSAVSTRSVQ